MDKVTPRHYWAISQFSQFDDHLRNNERETLEEAWKVLFPERTEMFWDLEFSDFMAVLMVRLEEVGKAIGNANVQVNKDNALRVMSWMNKEGTD
jgi:hypothetical protein